MQRIFGVVVLLAGSATTTGLGMLASRLSTDEQKSEIRAIIVHGPLVGEPVLIDDFKTATALYDEVEQTQKHAPLYPKELLMQRPCLVMALFLLDDRSSAVPGADLQPDHADVKFYYYPAVTDEPAVIGRARISPAQLDALASFGIPVSVPRAEGLSCADSAAVAAL